MSDPEVGQPGGWQATMDALNASPYYSLLGIQVVAMGEGGARLQMAVDEKLWQIYGVAHGGAIASLADSAVAVALISVIAANEKAYTVELKLNFVAPTRRGMLTAEARLFQRGRTIAAGDVEVRSEDGRLVARGIATYMPVKD